MNCLEAVLVALRLSLAMGHDDATASRAALGTWQQCSEWQQIGVAELESPQEAELLARATAPDLGRAEAERELAACDSEAAWIVRYEGALFGVCEGGDIPEGVQ